MAYLKDKTEDYVRNYAGETLGLVENNENGVKQGTGQITTFNNLGFTNIPEKNKKPDGWYLPKETYETALVLETKSTDEDLTDKDKAQIKEYCEIVSRKYKNVIGILYNGVDVIAYRNGEEITVADELQPKEYYLSLTKQDAIDKQKIYKITKRINDSLHFDFGIKNLYHRMIFTACALVAVRFNEKALMEGMDYTTFHSSIHSTLSKSLAASKQQNGKLTLLLDVYAGIQMNSTENQEAIDNFIENVKEISACINSDAWQGEDVMGIFFNEFNRYKKKSESGQVFTPDHITSLMCRVLDVNKDDRVLDAACGSGAFLVKAMCDMIAQAGGVNTAKAAEIKANQLYGIEFDKEVYALACANMLIHKDGKTNLEQMDSRTEEAGKWIASKKITKVLMNPPFEDKYGCMKIVANVLDNVPVGTQCAFIMPDKKLEKSSQGIVKRILKQHRLTKIIKLPEDLFFGQGITTSIFVFIAGRPQGEEEIFGCYIADDGLQVVKNQGRQDVYDKWKAIEDRWVKIIKRQSGDDTVQWIKPKEHLSYQMPEPPFEIFEEDFKKTVFEYLMFKQQKNVNDFKSVLIDQVLYGTDSISKSNGVITLEYEVDDQHA